MAADVRAVITAENADADPLFVLGHAFDNRVARSYAARYDNVAGTVLVAAGGKASVPRRVSQALAHCFWGFMPDFWRQSEIRFAFFAGNAIPEYWMRGWNIFTSRAQMRSTRNTPSREWWHGGTAPILAVQGMRDRIAPPEHTAVLLKDAFKDRVSVAEIDNAGHAILPEEPQQVSEAVLSFLAKLS